MHLSLYDDASVDAVLEPLADALAPSAAIVDHTTTAPTPTAERTARWKKRGKHYVAAPVFMGPKDAADGTGAMLVSATQAEYDALIPTLSKMTARVIYMGAQPGRANAFKLLGNIALISLTAIVGDMNRFAHGCSISTADAMSLFAIANPGATMPARAHEVVDGTFDAPTFTVAMARKDLELVLQEAQRHESDLCIVPGVAKMFDEGIARGDGSRDVNAAARLA